MYGLCLTEVASVEANQHHHQDQDPKRGYSTSMWQIADDRETDPEKLFRKWIEFVQRADLENMDIHKVRSNYRVCDNHFAPEYKIGDEYFSQSGLITGAVPTLNRSSNLKSDNTAPAVAGGENAVVIATVQPQYDPEAIAGPSHENNERMDFQQSEIFVPSVATENIKSNVGSRRAITKRIDFLKLVDLIRKLATIANNLQCLESYHCEGFINKFILMPPDLLTYYERRLKYIIVILLAPVNHYIRTLNDKFAGVYAEQERWSKEFSLDYVDETRLTSFSEMVDSEAVMNVSQFFENSYLEESNGKQENLNAVLHDITYEEGYAKVQTYKSYLDKLAIILDIEHYVVGQTTETWSYGPFEFLNHSKAEETIDELYKEIVKPKKNYKNKIRESAAEGQRLQFTGALDDPDYNAPGAT
ncbi:hypothetical protein RN001_007625 [Aquatica leii]|uniref:THAP-type domain-containing protein n=1 Tax=Aquatica leii TaxID=1421715 RepID=A0AAN7SGW9_9COLE|nr:hypothetical protein RN001_007625 [Aquatica leii]